MEKEISIPSFTTEELEKINALAIKNRFEGHSVKKILYPISDIERLKNFLSCYRLLESVRSCLDEESNKELYCKLGFFLDQTYRLYFEAVSLGRKADLLSNSFGSYNTLKVIGDFLTSNIKAISNLEDFVSQIGKVSKSNNPDEYQGNY